MGSRRGPLVLLSVVVVCLGLNTIYRAGFGSKLRTDLPVYLVGARSLLAGKDPFYVHSQDRGWPYVYPPTFAVLMIPLTVLPLSVAAAAWYLVSVSALVTGVVCFRRSLARDGPFRWVDDGVPLLLILIPSSSALLRGQLSPLLLGLLCASIYALVRRRDGWAGLLVSLAAAIKLTPALLMVGFLVARRWKAFGASLAGLVLWLVLVPMPFLGPAGTVRALEHFGTTIVGDYVRDPSSFKPAAAYPVHIKTNQSPASHIARRTSGLTSRMLLLGLLVVVLAPTLGLARSLRPREAPEEAATIPNAALLAAPLLVAPIAWHHYHVLLFPLLVLLVRWRACAWVLWVFAALSLVHFTVWSSRDYGLLGIGTLLVYGAFLLEAWRRASRPVDLER